VAHCIRHQAPIPAACLLTLALPPLSQDMVGRPVRAFVNVFGEWSRMHGEDASLLTALGLRALDGADEAWRVGVLAQGDGDSKVGGGLTAGRAGRHVPCSNIAAAFWLVHMLRMMHPRHRHAYHCQQPPQAAAPLCRTGRLPGQ
jgi:hypothetical protein